MEKEKFYTGEKFYTTKKVACGHYRYKYVDALPKYLERILCRASWFGLVKVGNDAKRGGKLGEFYKVEKFFSLKTLERLEKKQATERKKKEKMQTQLLKTLYPSDEVARFFTVSDIGGFKINNKIYSNFYGDGENVVQVCKVENFEAFKKADIITKRQIFNPDNKILIEKFDELKTLEIAGSDCSDIFKAKTIENACGFAIWERKLKIFVV